MPRGMFRSGRFRKVFVKTPGGEVHLHYRQRKPSKAVCATCGKVLAGVPHQLPAVLRNMPKTAKRPERPYGGVLCSKCMRVMFQTKARGESA